MQEKRMAPGWTEAETEARVRRAWGWEVSLLLGKVAARPGLCHVEAVEGRSPPAVCCAGRSVDLVL